MKKQSRLERQKQRITGLLHKSDQQPSHSLIDTVFHIMETGALTYVAPSRCYSREQEIQSEAKHKSKTDNHDRARCVEIVSVKLT